MANIGESLLNFGKGVALNAGRTGLRQREIIKWEVPNKPNQSIEMYINPQNITIASKKILQKNLTRGGFIIQYWGEDYDRASINGMTGSGGVEAINILKDVYRSEQKAFVAETKSLIDAARTGSVTNIAQTGAGLINKSIAGTDLSSKVLSTGLNALTGQTTSIGQSTYLGYSPSDTTSTSYTSLYQQASLARRATSVWMHYHGISYRGYFEDFQVIESVDHLGIFKYTITFNIIDSIGSRVNFMPWHRNPQLKAPGSLSYSGNLNEGVQSTVTGFMDKFNFG